MVYSFGCIPLFELFLRPNKKNLNPDQKEYRASDKFYDRLLYLVVPLHFSCLGVFLYTVWSQAEAEGLTYWGWVSSMGILNGVFGINVAHELGHRPGKKEQFLAQFLLLSSLYMHFFIEHNRGHHRYVATREDPATARKWEPVYVFWLRSTIGSWLQAWDLEFDRLKRKKIGKWSIHNQMVRFTAVQLLFCIGIFWLGGQAVGVAFLLSAGFGIMLLETVNYIEHYGLMRSRVSELRYEKVMPWHSWNSNHRVGRWMLFELSRHSDHHHRPARKYQLLEHHPHSRQLPTGYPGMMLISLLPPLFFGLIHPRLNAPVHS